MAQPIQKESHIWCVYVRRLFIVLLVAFLTGDTTVNVKAECNVSNVKAVVGESNAVDNTSEDHCK